MTDVSIVIVNYNTTGLAIDCIKSIRAMTDGISYEVILVDNGSENNVKEALLHEFGSDVIFVDAEVNLGFGKGNNLGTNYAKGNYLLFLNPDTLLLNNAIKIMHDHLESHPENVVAGGQMYLPNGAVAPSYSMCFDAPESDEKKANWAYMISSRIKNRTPILNARNRDASSDRAFQVAYVFGADMMIRRDVFQKIGGFDPDFFMYAEEAELSWRIRRAGYGIVCVPQAKIIHLEGASTQADGSFNEKQYRMRMDGKMMYYHKCFGINGLKRFYSATKKRLKRSALLSKFMRKKSQEVLQNKMIQILGEEYISYCRKMAEGKQNG